MSELLYGKHKRFIVEVTKGERDRMSTVPLPKIFTGKAIYSESKYHQVGKESDAWCNPYYDMAVWGACYFQQADQSSVQEFLNDKY